VFDFGALPPEINSGRMYSGPGSESMMVAASAWDELAAELGTAANGYGSVIDELTGGPWVGPSSASMVSAVVVYVSWLSGLASQAEETASRARAAAAAFETAFAMTVPPTVVVANRMLLMTLIATNFFGQNTPAIAATEAQYMEMWAQDAAAMYGYAASSATASQVPRFTSPPSTTTPDAESGQFAAVSQATATPAGNSGQTAAAATSQLLSAATVPQTLQQMSSAAAASGSHYFIWNTIADFLKYGLPTPTDNWAGLTPADYTTVIGQTLQAYFGVGVANYGWSIGQQLTFGFGTTVGSAGPWYPTPEFGGLHLGAGVGGVSAVSGNGAGAVMASAGQAGKVGMLSVPANWSTPTTEASATLAAMDETSPNAGAAPGTNALLRGMPTGAVGRRGAAYGHTNVYGARHSVVAHPPSAG
jgi:PPE-repeat protein